jgi:murein DD-endopeptidase MepM/ murein hydrolase activator NlpD
MSLLEKLKLYFSLAAMAFLFIYPAWQYLFSPDRDNVEQAHPGMPVSLIFPVEGASIEDIISGFGDPRGKRSHEGVDIKAPAGTPVLAAMAGIAHRVKSGGDGGRQIWLKNEAAGLTFYYAHLEEQWVREGEKVRAGQAIGAVGNTGNASATRPHLHFEVHRGRREAVDPVPFLSKIILSNHP